MPSTISELVGLLGNAGAVANVQNVQREQRRQEALVDTLLAAVDRADARRHAVVQATESQAA